MTPINKSEVILRAPQPGDMGWVIQQHGEIYWREYGWNQDFEALVLDIIAKMMKRPFDPSCEAVWIAEYQGQRIGCAFLVRQSKRVGKPRLILLTPEARGLGLARRMMEEMLAFARKAGYKKLRLWTHSCLTSARSLYASLGFVLVSSDAYHGFGKDVVGEEWELVIIGA